MPEKIDLNPIIKPAGRNCNAACRYCFYRTEAGADDRMTDEILQRITAEVSRVARRPIFSWQGGEPTLMGLDFFRKAVDLQKQHNPGSPPPNAFQTNGILIDGQWASFLAQNRFLTGLSIDGPRDVHDSFRTRANGSGTFNSVIRAADLLAHHNAEFNILTVLGKHNVSQPERLWRFFRSKGFRFLQFIPCLQHAPDGAVLAPNSPDPDDLADFYCAFFDLYFEDARGRLPVSVRLFDNVLSVLLGYPPAACVYASTCSNQIVFDADGSVYACDWYVLPEWRLGSIMESPLDELLTGERNRAFAERSTRRPDLCDNCKWLSFCFGGCPLHRSVTPDGRSCFCAAYTRLFDYAMPRFQQIAREIHERRSTQERRAPTAAHTPPNDPCPCGSGRKFKKCCARKPS